MKEQWKRLQKRVYCEWERIDTCGVVRARVNNSNRTREKGKKEKKGGESFFFLGDRLE
jgi:hypothetical protein